MYAAIAGFLLGLLTRVKRERNNEASTRKSPQNNMDGEFNPIVLSYTPAPLSEEEKADKRDEKRRAKRKSRIELAGFIVLCFYTFFTGFMAWEMKESTDASQKAATAARDSADIQSALIKGENAARCSLHPEIIPDVLTLEFTNSGKVAARSFHAVLKLTQITLPKERLVGVAQPFDVTADRIYPTASVTKTFSDVGFTPRARESLLQTRLMLKIEGSMQYDDGFGQVVHEPICFSRVAGQPIGTGSVQETWLPCDVVPHYLRNLVPSETRQP